MHPDCAHLHSIQGGGDDSSCSCSSRLAAEGSSCPGDVRIPLGSSCPGDVRIPLGSSCPGDVRIQLGSGTAESRDTPSSRGSRAGSQSRGHGEAAGPEDAEPEEQGGSSLAELRCLLQWLHRSLPYLLILSVKLLLQHSTGISLGIGLLTTYAYANKSIVNQVFLRVSITLCNKILKGAPVTSDTSFCSLIFLSPTVDFMNFWEVLWIVGVTDFILKFLFMGLKCFILLVPSFIMSFKSKGYWYMLLEELCQYYRMFVPIPVWCRYLMAHGGLDTALGWSLGVLLGLLYLILKLLSFFGQWKNFRQVLRIFFTRPHYGVPASKRQCSESDDICSICQAEFQKPILLICQHIFCEECISLWFNREKTCPLCRTVISDHVNKWKDGATSMHLQIF
uniref:E3 ubiquitin-protein ligase RNFT1 n=1 Tax=Junco hyemalis TaxID=40217 RepID=A0A8C5JKW9_JUNHY